MGLGFLNHGLVSYFHEECEFYLLIMLAIELSFICYSCFHVSFPTYHILVKHQKAEVFISAVFFCSWVVVLPSGSRNPTKPFKLQLALYPSVQVLLSIICRSLNLKYLCFPSLFATAIIQILLWALLQSCLLVIQACSRFCLIQLFYNLESEMVNNEINLSLLFVIVFSFYRDGLFYTTRSHSSFVSL